MSVSIVSPTQSQSKPKLFQTKPFQGKAGGKYPDRSWKTINGFKWNSRRQTYCLQENEKLRTQPYQLVGTVNICADLTVDQIRLTWAKICRKLNSIGVECWWIREVSKRNRVHYHLIIGTSHDPKTLKKTIKSAAPNIKRFRMQFEPFKMASKNWIAYICKAEISGTERQDTDTDDVDCVCASPNAKRIEDVYGKKRLLFARNVRLVKVGSFGNFWVKKSKELWKPVAQKTKIKYQTIAKHIHDDDVVWAASP
jgi:hypothetical protein